jgi:aryl-alcohol dehydrogenase-like predicted oxidoreductase
MKYKNIPGTVLNSSTICLGGGSFCVENAKEYSFNLMDTYFDQGGNFIDTANIYGKWLKDNSNLSEIVMGEWMHERKNRNKLIIASKGGHPNLKTMNISRLSRSEVLQDLEESLNSLQTDYIDLYWLHRDDENLPVPTIIDYLNDFVKAGKIRYFGCSNWKVERIKEALDYSKKYSLRSFVGNQMMWSLAKPNEDAFGDKSMVFMEDNCFKFHKETMLAAIPYSSQANGFFEKINTKKQIPLSNSVKLMYYNQRNMKRFDNILKVADYLSKSISETVLGYLISQPFTTIPIIGCSSSDQLKQSLKAGDLILEKDIVELLEKNN